MSNVGLKMLIFTLTVHTLLVFGAQNGIIGEEQAGQSREYVSKFQNDDLVQGADIQSDDSGLLGEVSLAIKSVPLIGDIYDFITTPYGLMVNSNLPWLIKTLVTGTLGAMELAVAFKMWRGIDL